MYSVTNEDRAEWARIAVGSFNGGGADALRAIRHHAEVTHSTHENYETQANDLLCNLGHMAAEDDADWQEACRLAELPVTQGNSGRQTLTTEDLAEILRGMKAAVEELEIDWQALRESAERMCMDEIEFPDM